MRLLLVRHAHAPWTPDEMRPLSAAGTRAAEALAVALDTVSVHACYASPYRRALDTVAPLAERRQLPVAVRDALRERALGDIGERSFADAAAATFADPGSAHPGGESNRVAQARVVDLVAALGERHAGECVALGTHGTMLTLLLQAFDPRVGLDFWQSLAFPDAILLETDGPRRGRFHRPAPGPVIGSEAWETP